MRTLAGALRWVAVLAVGVLLGIVSGRYVIDRPTRAPDAAVDRVAVRVEEGTIERTLQLPATGAWDLGGAIRSPSGGVITAVVAKSGLMSPGDVMLRIDERPVILIPGDVPAFRELQVGTRGRDVTALQRYLASRGFRVDERISRYSTVTRAAVRRWQRELGLPDTGVVALGDVVFVPEATLDAPLRWTDAVALGATITSGVPILDRLEPAPTLTVDFGGSVPAQLTPGLPGEVSFPSGARRAVTLSSIHQDPGRTWATLESMDDALCSGVECTELVPIDGEAPLDVTFTLVPETTGPLVPVAAVQSDATGRAFVELPDGSRRAVRVRVASGGSAIVEGLDVGEEVVLP